MLSSVAISGHTIYRPGREITSSAVCGSAAQSTSPVKAWNVSVGEVVDMVPAASAVDSIRLPLVRIGGESLVLLWFAAPCSLGRNRGYLWTRHRVRKI